MKTNWHQYDPAALVYSDSEHVYIIYTLHEQEREDNITRLEFVLMPGFVGL